MYLVVQISAGILAGAIKFPVEFVYVIGLYAVQFGNNWMKKFRGQPKLDESIGRVQFCCQRNFRI